ncbi:LytR/AlgR family response regulator transcription factor [Pontibacter vulgaris]|uniref:LytR/AlgR family response regulator transcription factor n=1 Tax=Pontibacter vulgaris TaxID=2905679 RepID=UPI001FA7A658|nr:LytTR family DNA-binding domain-containing protein [Pontibacter vulgaris]
MQPPEDIKCIIIEDELPAASVLQMHIARFPFLKLKDTFSSCTKALSVLNSEKVDLIFLDINLPGVPGNQFASTIKATTGIIFTTAYSDYAVQGFELNAVDYLLKPISFERFSKAINRYLTLYQHNSSVLPAVDKVDARPFVFIKCDRKMVKIFLDDILYLEAQRNCLLIYTENEVYRSYQAISEMEEKLPDTLFVRMHRSFIIALDKVKAYNNSYVVIQDKQIPIGRMYSDVINSTLKANVK